MKLIIELIGNEKGLASANAYLECDLEPDAEMLGYSLCFITSIQALLESLATSVNPKYSDRVLKGMNHAKTEKDAEGNDVWPFHKFYKKDEIV